jgi:hypothetical protein
MPDMSACIICEIIPGINLFLLLWLRLKHNGGLHIFLFMGGAIVVLVLIKLLIDRLMN